MEMKMVVKIISRVAFSNYAAQSEWRRARGSKVVQSPKWVYQRFVVLFPKRFCFVDLSHSTTTTTTTTTTFTQSRRLLCLLCYFSSQRRFWHQQALFIFQAFVVSETQEQSSDLVVPCPAGTPSGCLYDWNLNESTYTHPVVSESFLCV